MRRDWLAWLSAVIWFGALLAGIVGWEWYTLTPGSKGTPEAIEAEPGGWRMTIFVHPHCPCTRTTLTDLMDLGHADPDLAVRVVFVIPPDAPAEWWNSPSRAIAESISGVEIVRDDGTEARRSGAETSGHTFLIDPTGRTVFCGGLTPGRGRDGALRAWLSRMKSSSGERVDAPVYGCPLFTPNP